MAVDSLSVFRKAIPSANANILTAVKDTLSANAAKFGLTTSARIAAFMAQAAVETAGFTTLREIWGPTAAQNRYEGNVNSLGNTQPGDGKKFMGRGIFQTTGRANYQSVSRKIFGDDRLLSNPALLESPQYATLSALHFWNDRNLNQLADINDINGLTRKINGTGATQSSLSARANYWNALKSVIAVSPVAFLSDFLKKKSNSAGSGNILSGVRDGIAHFFGL